MSPARARWAVFAAAAAVAGLLALTGWLEPARATRAADDPDGCTVLQFENTHSGAPTTVRRVSLPSGETESTRSVGYWLNAAGYAPDQGRVYAVADGTRSGRFHDGAHAVGIDASGHVTDLGPVIRAGARRPTWSMITDATAGAVAGKTWYLRKDFDLYAVDIDPASPNYLRVTSRMSLRPSPLAVGIDDFAYDPADGLLYGVSMSYAGGGAVVTVDPSNGHIGVVPGLRFPHATAYGGVVIGPDDALYATANRIGHRSITYRLPRDGSAPATEIATGDPLVTGDTAGCLTASAPPVTSSSEEPTSAEPTSTRSSPPPTTSSPAPSSPVPSSPVPPPAPVTELPTVPSELPPVEQPQAVAPTPTPTPTPAEPAPTAVKPAPHREPPPKVKPLPPPASHAAQTKWERRWSLTALILVLGGGAAAAHLRRR